MEQSTMVSFEWSVPDEGEFDESGNPGLPGGRNIFQYIHGALQERGVQVTEIDLHEDYGWYMDAVSDGVSVWCLIQFSGPWLVLTDVPFRFWHWFRGRKPAAQQSRVCKAIHDALQSSDKAHSIQWFSSRLYQANKGQNGVSHP